MKMQIEKDALMESAKSRAPIVTKGKGNDDLLDEVNLCVLMLYE